MNTVVETITESCVPLSQTIALVDDDQNILTSVSMALEAEGYRITRIDVDRNLATRLIETKPDVVFNALHGPFGEDGTVQGMLEIMGIPYQAYGQFESQFTPLSVIAQTCCHPAAQEMELQLRQLAL